MAQLPGLLAAIAAVTLWSVGLSSLVDCSHCSDAQALISYVVCPGQVIEGGSAFDGAAIAGKASSSSNRFMAQYSLVFKF